MPIAEGATGALSLCSEGCYNACLCCGSVGTACCPQGKEGYCSCFNHCICLGPACCDSFCLGANGCLGFDTPLCACCRNCNLMCYLDCCSPCMLADMAVSTMSDHAEAKEKWKAIVCTLVVLFNVGSFLGSLDNGADQSTFFGLITFLVSIVGDIMQAVGMVYCIVIFGKSASLIAAKQGKTYEPAECFENCCESAMSQCRGCSDCTCCLTFWCCGNCHFLQVALSMDGDMSSKVNDRRPEECACCNCWEQPGVDGGSADATQNL